MKVNFLAYRILPLFLLSACATVRQQDLDAWVGMPVEALDTQTFFITVPMYKTFTESGLEIRNYANGRVVATCLGNMGGFINGNLVTATSFSTCSNRGVVCNNIFYIKNGKVLEYAPTGRCYTKSFVQPETRYMHFREM